MSNRDVLNDNVRLVRLVEKLTIQRDDLLAALATLVADWDSIDDQAIVPNEMTNEHWDVARAVIAKAKGGG